MAELPQNIGKYAIRSLLGKGAMGSVYEGFDPDIERRVAIKTLHRHLVENRKGDEFLERFKREAKSAARCVHPNIVTVLEYGQDDDIPFIVMEFVEGASLQQIIKRGRGISLQHSLSIVSQLLKALHAAHRLKIVHRDIKAANVMILKQGGSVKLADFGIARFDESPELTKTGAVVGTPKYMAPEQMFGLKVDARADLFSVAMVFLELLTLLPKNDSIPLSELPEIVNLPPNNIIDYSILYPSALIPVLNRALAVNQEQRFQNAREFMQAIRDVLPGIKSTAVAAGPEDDTAVLQESTQKITASKEELDSMTRLLVDYIGPIAKNIMHAHDAENTSIAELATEVAKEIPHAEEREAFLKRWQSISDTRPGATTLGGSQAGATAPGAHAFDEAILEQLGRDYAEYIGPMAARLVRHYSSSAASLEQLVESLAREIPDAGDSKKFKDAWL